MCYSSVNQLLEPRPGGDQPETGVLHVYGGTLAQDSEPTNGRQRASRYDAQDITVLEGLEAVRKRPGMYIGSTDSRGLMHCLWEIIDNSVDEAARACCEKRPRRAPGSIRIGLRNDTRLIPVRSRAYRPNSP